jgi:hypothetical protein
MFTLTKREQRTIVFVLLALVLGTLAKLHVDLGNKPLPLSAPNSQRKPGTWP